ncbi:uncharacterized protein CCOS01_02509 [Colletotrichum costaricense]|uniref:Importin 13 n=1 Tax=Colletotrichum costaricense TaxID=1209916 RepID=A0AAJ0E5C8_9PEZI|nr:uncharacterized protein CCOS01_02509 [Colletotrichum costaricense]KAK1537189.1 hypothetical protein CCOS01_02509 [Colletotrichum costaricense]
MEPQLPSTIQEAEALVLALYEPSPPETIARIQETLHRMQRSPSGWWIARDLLGYADDKVKFFGALTLIVKLNTERFSSLSKEDASELLQNLIGWFVRSLDDGSGAMVVRKLSAALSWVWFSQRVSAHNDELVHALRALVQPTITALCDNELYEVAVELLSEILSNYSGFLTDEHYESLFSLFETQWSHERYQRLVQGDFDFDSVQFGQLMIALGDSKVEDLIHGVDARSSRFVAHLRGLLSAQGYPVSEDKIFVPALEFWSTYVETLTDCIYSEEEGSKEWVSTATSHVLEAISTVWQRIAYPPASVLADWDSVDRAGFGDARKDVADLLQSTFTVTGPPLISTFANLTLQSLSPNSSSDLEAATFCLGSLADCVTGDARCDESLRAVFSSPLFDLLQTSGSSMPGRTRQTCISLIERYSDYFERETQSLPAALNLLFSVLADPLLAGPAAKSILQLCSSSRSILASEASAFLSQYEGIAAQSQLDCLAVERIMGAIAAVIQAVPDESTKFDHINFLLSFVQKDARLSMHLLSLPRLQSDASGSGTDIHRCPTLGDPSELPLHMALKALRCLIGIGKGLQAPGDVPFDLDSEKDIPATDSSSRLGHLQSGIMSMIVQLQRAFPQSDEISESICTIFRSGFSESDAGPFVFPPGLSGDVDEVRTKLLRWVITLLQQQPEPDNDVELAQNGIEFTNRLISREPASLFRPDCLPLTEFFFIYALRILDGREPLPKAAAADFWATFMALKPADATIDHAIAQLGPLLAQSIVRNIGGTASRSELDRLSEPLKKMVSNQAKARNWLEQALSDPSFPSQQLAGDEKAVFLKKIMNLRGARGTNQVVRDFWLAARGSNFAYAS